MAVRCIDAGDALRIHAFFRSLMSGFGPKSAVSVETADALLATARDKMPQLADLYASVKNLPLPTGAAAVPREMTYNIYDVMVQTRTMAAEGATVLGTMESVTLWQWAKGFARHPRLFYSTWLLRQVLREHLGPMVRDYAAEVATSTLAWETAVGIDPSIVGALPGAHAAIDEKELVPVDMARMRRRTE